MASYQVFRLKENLRQQFRWAPHLSGVTGVKEKDYEFAYSMEAESPYALWHSVNGTEGQLRVGDVICCGEAELRILKYIGFEEARWIVPESRASQAGPSGALPEPSPALG